MKTIKTILIAIAIPLFGFSQSELNPLNSTPYIEVTGEGEMEIIPDEIFLQFTLKERYDGKTKIEIEDLEKKLKKQLNAQNFDLDNLSLADADANFVTIKRKKKDVLASKDFQLKISGTKELADAWEILDNIDVLNAHISKLDHSQIEKFKKEVKIMAVKNAKEKADYMLATLEQKTGKVLFIQERETYSPVPYTRMKLEMASFDERNDTPALKEPEISFQKIKLSYKVFARFAIE